MPWGAIPCTWGSGASNSSSTGGMQSNLVKFNSLGWLFDSRTIEKRGVDRTQTDRNEGEKLSRWVDRQSSEQINNGCCRPIEAISRAPPVQIKQREVSLWHIQVRSILEYLIDDCKRSVTSTSACPKIGTPVISARESLFAVLPSLVVRRVWAIQNSIKIRTANIAS